MTEENEFPQKGRCACKFSSGGVLSKQCEFHTRLIQSAISQERNRCAQVCEKMIPSRELACRGTLIDCAAAIRGGSNSYRG